MLDTDIRQNKISPRLTFKAEVVRGADLSVLELVFQGDVLVTVLTALCPTPAGHDVLLQIAQRESQLTILATLKPLCAFVCLKVVHSQTQTPLGYIFPSLFFFGLSV